MPANACISRARLGLVQRSPCALMLLLIQAELEVLPAGQTVTCGAVDSFSFRLPFLCSDGVSIVSTTLDSPQPQCIYFSGMTVLPTYSPSSWLFLGGCTQQAQHLLDTVIAACPRSCLQWSCLSGCWPTAAPGQFLWRVMRVSSSLVSFYTLLFFALFFSSHSPVALPFPLCFSDVPLFFLSQEETDSSLGHREAAFNLPPLNNVKFL